MGHPMARVDFWNRRLGTLYRHDLCADLSAVHRNLKCICRVRFSKPDEIQDRKSRFAQVITLNRGLLKIRVRPDVMFGQIQAIKLIFFA